MPGTKGAGDKHYLSDMYLTNEAAKLIPSNEKLNNIIQNEAPLLEKKINIDDVDVYEVKQPKLRKLRKSRLFIALIGTACAMIVTGAVIMALFMSKGRKIAICPVGDGYPLQEVKFPYIPEGDILHKSSKFSDSKLFRPMATTEKNDNNYLHFSSINSMPGPVIIESTEIESEKKELKEITTENPLIERNLDDNCDDGMISYSIGPNIKICASHKEVKVEDMGWAVEDCKNIKGHLPHATNQEELKYIGGLLKDMSSMTRMRHLSPILVKREAKNDEFESPLKKDDRNIMEKGWSFYQAMNQSQDMDGANKNSVGILCIRPLDDQDLGMLSKIESDMVNMMKNVRDRVSSVFRSPNFFGNH